MQTFKSPHLTATSAAIESTFSDLKCNILKVVARPMSADKLLALHVLSIEGSCRITGVPVKPSAKNFSKNLDAQNIRDKISTTVSHFKPFDDLLPGPDSLSDEEKIVLERELHSPKLSDLQNYHISKDNVEEVQERVRIVEGKTLSPQTHPTDIDKRASSATLKLERLTNKSFTREQKRKNGR